MDISIILTFLPVGIFFLLWLFKLLLQSWKFSFCLFVLIVTLIDFIRRFFEGQVLMLIALDCALLLLLCSFYLPLLLGAKSRIGIVVDLNNALGFSLCFYSTVIVCLAIMTSTTSVPVALAGLRSYLLALPTIGIGWYIARSWREQDYWNASTFIFFCIGMTVLFGAFRYVVDPTNASELSSGLFLPMEHGIHSFGDTEVGLSSSFFASSKRWARYLLFMYFFAWADYEQSCKKRLSIFLSILVLTGLLLSGSRESLFLFSFFHLTLALLKSIKRFLFLVSGLAIVGILVVLVHPSAYPESNSSGLFLRGRFLISTSEDWISRLSSMSIEPFPILMSGDVVNFLIGEGIGTYGQETQFFSDVAFGSVPDWLTPGVLDAGLTKILFEMGSLGILVFLSVQGCILSYIRHYSAKKLDAFWLASLFSCFSWIVFFFKGHPIINDLSINTFYWFYVGVLIGRSNMVTTPPLSLKFHSRTGVKSQIDYSSIRTLSRRESSSLLIR